MRGCSTRLIVSILAAVIVIVILFIKFSSESEKIFMSGELTSNHWFIENDCRKCHEPWKGVTIPTCLNCHSNRKHFENKKIVVALEYNVNFPKCNFCHPDHRGKPYNIKLVEDLKCIGCHDEGLHEGGDSSHYKRAKKPDLLFTHKFHSKYQGFGKDSCDRCHSELDSSGFFKLTATFDEDCAECHLPARHDNESSEKGSCKECHTHEEYEVAQEKKISLHNLIDSHEEHSNYKCIECHEGILKTKDAMDIEKFDRSHCYNCHNEETVKNDCITCHSFHLYKVM